MPLSRRDLKTLPQVEKAAIPARAAGSGVSLLSLATLLAFTLAMFLLAASPGPGFLMVVARALTGGLLIAAGEAVATR